MTLKSIEKLRDTVTTFAAQCDVGWMLNGLDKIESEIAERYMLLPVDADGVPIHVGDKILWVKEGPFEVCGVNNDSVWFDGSDKEWVAAWANVCHHYNPRTVEDVLEDFVRKSVEPVSKNKDIDLSEVHLCITKNGMDECAAEIRDLLGGDGR